MGRGNADSNEEFGARFTMCCLLHEYERQLVDLRGTSWEKHSQKECGLDPYLLYAVALTESKNNAGTKGYVVPSPGH